MNNKARSDNRFLLNVALMSVLISIFSGCSTLSKKNSEVSEESSSGSGPQSWYECKSGADGKSWDCGSDLDEYENETLAMSREPDPESQIEEGRQGEIEEVTGVESLVSEESAAIEAQKETGQEETSQVKEKQPISESETASDVQQAVYTIQIGAFAGETKRDIFIEENSLQELPLDFYESVKDGRTWWVLTHGEYIATDEAREASAKLDREFGLADTWVRPLDQLRPQNMPQNASQESSTSENVLTQPEEAKPPVQSEVDDEDFYDPRYVIQLAAFTNEQKRTQFVSEQGISELELVYVEEGRVGVTWWIILYGEFELVEDAREKQDEIELLYGLSNTWIKPIQN